MNLRRVLLLAQKESRHILRDFRTVYMALGIPLVLLLLFGYALTMDITTVPMVVVDRDRSPASRELIGTFERTGTFAVAEVTDDPDAILPSFRTNRTKVALVIQHGFARSLDRGETGAAQIIVDGTDANVGAIAMGYAASIGQIHTLDLTYAALDTRGMLASRTLKPPVTVKSRNWFNPDLKSQWYMVPGLVALIMAMMSAILMSLTVAREWERGTMEQLLVTPVRPLEILLGKLIPYFVIGIGQITLVIGAGVLLFEVPLEGNIGLLYALSSIFLLGALAQGLFISIATRQQQVAMQLALLSSMLPALLLSGFMSPISSMPWIIRGISHIVPARYFLVITRGIFLKGLGLAELLPQTAALLIFATIMVALGVKSFKTRLDP